MPLYDVKCSMASGTAGFPKAFCIEADDKAAAEAKAKEEYVRFLKDTFVMATATELQVISGRESKASP